MCRLVKALYGHPESGAHWERRLERAVQKFGGVRVPDHTSLYRFPQQGLLLATISCWPAQAAVMRRFGPSLRRRELASSQLKIYIGSLDVLT